MDIRYCNVFMNLSCMHFKLPFKIWLPVVVALNLPMSAWVAWRNRDAIDWTLLLRQILPVMAVGFAVGVAAAFVLSGNWLRTRTVTGSTPYGPG